MTLRAKRAADIAASMRATWLRPTDPRVLDHMHRVAWKHVQAAGAAVQGTPGVPLDIDAALATFTDQMCWSGAWLDAASILIEDRQAEIAQTVSDTARAVSSL